MGLFDSVFARCPKCDGGVEFQSKAGECRLTSHSIMHVPIAIAMDIEGDVEECECGTKLEIHTMMDIPKEVAMFVSVQYEEIEGLDEKDF